MQVSIGRLGVITSVVFRIRKNQPVIRNLLMTNLAGLADKLVGIQNAYNAATTDADRAAAVAPLNLQQTTWCSLRNSLTSSEFSNTPCATAHNMLRL